MVEIDKLNRQYLIYRRLIEEKNNMISEWQREIDSLAEDYQLEEASIIKANREGKIGEERQAEENIEKIRKKVAEIEKKAIIEAEEIKDMLQDIDKLLEKILEDDELKNAMIQCLEEQYISKIEELTKRKKQSEIAHDIIERIRKILQENPAVVKEMQNAVESLTALKRINNIIYNLEHNGMLSKEEASNKSLLEKSKREKEKQEKRKTNSYTNMRNILSISEYAIIEEKIKEMVEISFEEDKKVDVKRKIEREAKETQEQKLRLEESIKNNKRELELLRQKKKNKWWSKGIKQDKKEGIEDKRKEFLDRIGYEIVREGMHKIKNEVREQRIEKGEK